MIPETSITAWSLTAPWAEPGQVEQDLIISRTLVEIFNHDLLRTNLRFRGGTALNKTVFPELLRYSEDIDLVRTSAGPKRPIFDALRDVLEPWLGKGNFVRSRVAPKLRFRVPTEDNPDVQVRLKVEINIAETEAFDPPVSIPYAVENPWFTGRTTISSFSPEELLATKLRALLQRNKGRDLFDLDYALAALPGLDIDRVMALFIQYLDQRGQTISRAEAEQRMLAKFARPDLLADIRPLLNPDRADVLDGDAGRAAFVRVFNEVIALIPGHPWARTEELAQSMGLAEITGMN